VTGLDSGSYVQTISSRVIRLGVSPGAALLLGVQVQVCLPPGCEQVVECERGLALCKDNYTGPRSRRFLQILGFSLPAAA
jgi:hypothetical protein